MSCELKFGQPGMSSLQATSAPDVQLLRTYSTVSKLVAAVHVEMVAFPDTVGVHAKTFSGAVDASPQEPVSVPVPLVLAVKTPPVGGIVVAASHEVAGIVVVVVVGSTRVIVTGTV